MHLKINVLASHNVQIQMCGITCDPYTCHPCHPSPLAGRGIHRRPTEHRRIRGVPEAYPRCTRGVSGMHTGCIRGFPLINESHTRIPTNTYNIPPPHESHIRIPTKKMSLTQGPPHKIHQPDPPPPTPRPPRVPHKDSHQKDDSHTRIPHKIHQPDPHGPDPDPSRTGAYPRPRHPPDPNGAHNENPPPVAPGKNDQWPDHPGVNRTPRTRFRVEGRIRAGGRLAEGRTRAGGGL